MSEKYAIVTGGSRGIGKAIVQKLAQSGFGIIINYLKSAEQAQALCAEIQSAYGVPCEAVQADVSDHTQAETLIQAAMQTFGRIDVLVNNAGITRDGLVLRMKEDQFDEVIRVNLKSAYNCIRHVAPVMFKQRSGRVVNISSVVARTGNVGQVNYCAAKAGVEGMTRACAREFAPRGITVNAVAPGFIETDMTAGLADKYREAMLQGIPLQRLGLPEDIANVVEFLCGDGASYITGQVLCVDGGLGMGGI